MSAKKKFRGGFIVYVNDRSGELPRKTPKRKLAVTRSEMYVFVSELGHKIEAVNIGEATKIAVANGWGTVRSL